MSKRADILSAFHRHKDKTLRPRSSDGITTELCRRRGKKPPKEDIPDFSPWRERSHQFLLFLVISFSVRGLYVFLFPNCCSFDLAGWKEVGNVLLAGGNPYHLTNKLNYPPLWMQFVFVFQKISLGLNVPFYEVIKGFLILAEGLLAGLLYAALLRFTEADKAAKWLILGIAINPIAVFQVCQHCHFDVLVGFWNLLAVYMLLRFQEEHDSHFWLVACLALGLGTLTKIVPLCLAPLLLLSVRRLKFTDHVLGVVLLLGPVLLALSIVYVLGPADIETRVLGYRSIPGRFGLTGLFALWGAKGLLDVWPRVFEIIYGTGWLLLGLWLWSKDTLDKRTLVTIAAASLIVLPTFGPGSGLHYIYWFLPLLILLHGLAEHRMRMFLTVMYLAAAVAYTLEYALNFNTYGAFFLDIVQTGPLLKWGLKLSTLKGETLVTLPLAILYAGFVAQCGQKIGGEMIRDFLVLWRQTHVFHRSERHGGKPAPIFSFK